MTSARDELRTVVDVLAPEADRHGALDEADRLARQLGSRGLPAGQERLLRRHQHRLPLRFGAWLGSRHTARTSTRKLYAEVDAEPERTRMLVDALAGDARRVLAGIGPVRLIGVSLDDPASVEVYVRPPFTDGDMVRALMGRAGIPHLAEPLCAAMAGGRAEPSGRNHGVSLTYSDGRLTAVAGFTFAHHMYRHDHRVRGAVLGLARTQRWPSESLYEAASRPLARPRPSCRPVHTALSAVAVVDGSAIIHHVGMAPPPATDPLSCSDRAPASTS